MSALHAIGERMTKDTTPWASCMTRFQAGCSARMTENWGLYLVLPQHLSTDGISKEEYDESWFSIVHSVPLFETPPPHLAKHPSQVTRTHFQGRSPHPLERRASSLVHVWRVRWKQPSSVPRLCELRRWCKPPFVAA